VTLTNVTRRRIVRAVTLIAGLAPAVALLARGLLDKLGANPVEEITHETGTWALRFLLSALAVTPARRWLGWSWLAPERRTLGLLAFGYATLHFATYLSLDLSFDFAALAEDILERPYITVGFASFVAMVPLAATSTKASMKRLAQRWTKLHRLAYVAATGAVLHYLWLVKADLRDPAIYAVILASLLIARKRLAPPG
jgi:sulfoxide reductase heme-binding subunit YedZ